MAEKKELAVIAAGGVAGAVVVSAVAAQDRVVIAQAGELGKASNLLGVVGGGVLVALAATGKLGLKGNARNAVAGAGIGMLGAGAARVLMSMQQAAPVPSKGLWKSGQLGPVRTPLPLGVSVVRPAVTV